MDELTYPEVGATRDWPLPRGYHHVRRRARLGSGTRVYAAAVEGLRTFGMQRRAGLTVRAPGPVAEGVEVRLGMGAGPVRLWAPCRVVWVIERPDQYAYGYGTLPGHPVRGEEGFLLWREPDGGVWLEIRAFSRPARWYALAAGPARLMLQDLATTRYARALREIARRPGT